MRARALLLVLCGAMVLILTGCAIGREPPSHAGTLAAATLGLTATPTPAIDAEWWRALADPQLDALMAQALSNSPSLGDALARLHRAQAAASIATGALQPQLDAALVEGPERLSARSFYPPPYGGGTYWNGSAEAALNWSLDFWGRQRDRVAAAEANAAASTVALRGARLALETALVGEYLALDRAHELHELAQRVATGRERIASLVAARMSAGLDTTIDERAARASAAAARVEEQDSAVRVDLTVHRIAELTGQGASGYAAIHRPTLRADTVFTVPVVLPGDLLLRRGDVSVALSNLRARMALEHAARMARYPDINLRAFAGFSAFGISNLLSAPARTMGASVAVALPLYDSGRLRAELHSASADVDAAIDAYNAVVLMAVREVADQLAIIDSVGREIADARARFALLDDALRLTTARRDAGLSADVAVIEVQLRRLEARRTCILLESADAAARVALIAALGGSPFDPPSSASIAAKGAP